MQTEGQHTSFALKHIFHPDRSSSSTRECRKEMVVRTPCPIHIPLWKLKVWKSPQYNLVESRIRKLQLTDLLRLIVKNYEDYPISNDSGEIEYGAPIPFGHITVEVIFTETKPHVEEVRCDMVIHDTGMLRNRVAEDEAPVIDNQVLDTTIHKSQVKNQL